MNLQYTQSQIFQNMMPYLKYPGPFIETLINQDFPETYFQMDFPILVVGAGGLGCEMIKNLALTGFNTIHLIDLDTIDITNLNRQFLFRQKDVGKFKAEVAAQFIMNRIPNVKVIPHTCKIQEKPKSFYEQFSIIIAGLDNVQARRWLNQLVHSLCQFNEEGQLIVETRRILIDGGTQRFSGQCMIIKPFQTSCYQCVLPTLPKQQIFNSCTIAKTPRIPQHCIQYAFQIQWQAEFGEKKVDNDNPDHIAWIYKKALQRAENFGIKGVTYMLTLGVIKNIIPAIASTNALIAAICTSQAFKLTTATNPSLNNAYYYYGTSSVGSHTFQYQKLQNCSVCSKKPCKITLNYVSSLSDLLKILQEDPYRFNKPLIQAGQGYLVNPLIESCLMNQKKTFKQLIQQKRYQLGQKLYISYMNSMGISSQAILKLELIE